MGTPQQQPLGAHETTMPVATVPTSNEPSRRCPTPPTPTTEGTTSKPRCVDAEADAGLELLGRRSRPLPPRRCRFRPPAEISGPKRTKADQHHKSAPLSGEEHATSTRAFPVQYHTPNHQDTAQVPAVHRLPPPSAHASGRTAVRSSGA